MYHLVLCETTSMYYVWGWHGSRLVPHTDSVTWSIEAKLSFMTVDGGVGSDHLVLAAKRKTLRQTTSCTHQSVRHKLAWSLHPFRINGRSD